MKSFNDIRESLTDFSSHSTKKLNDILDNPNHPHHASAKAEMERRGMKEAGSDVKKDDLKKDLEAMKARLQTEKTLTPAEKRKREKIAKAIERENPNMPMDKKMAIATATAKRVAEVKEDSDTHVTKDGKTAKKGLWYYMNKRKKAGTSRPKSAGTVDPDALKKSQK